MIEAPAFDIPEKLPYQRVQGPVIPLTQRQKEVLILAARGLTEKEIAFELNPKISAKTVKNNVSNMNHQLLEANIRNSIWRALITEEITTAEVFPEGFESQFEKLSPGEMDSIRAIAEIPGNIQSLQTYLGKSIKTIRDQSLKGRKVLSALNSAHSTALYFAYKEQISP